MKPIVSDGTNHDIGSFELLQQYANGSAKVFNVNPHTGEQWLKADAESMQFGFQNVASDVSVTVAQSGLYYGMDTGNGSAEGTFPSGSAITLAMVYNTNMFYFSAANNGKWDGANQIRIHAVAPDGTVASNTLSWDVSRYRGTEVAAFNNIFKNNVGGKVRLFVEAL